MKIRLMNNQYLVNGDYQPVVVRFSVKTSGNYVLGIYGSISTRSTYLSIDNIRIVESTGQYTVTAAANESGLLTVSANTAYPGDTITVRRTMNDGYAFCRYNTVPQINWLTDSTFVMPDENINIEMITSQAKPVPFFDGFEEGNQHQQSVAGWFVKPTFQNEYWKADNSKAPYEGTWTAFFAANNRPGWMFNAITLEAGKTYTVSMRAKQTVSETTSTAQTLQVCLGNMCNEKGDDYCACSTNYCSQHALSDYSCRLHRASDRHLCIGYLRVCFVGKWYRIGQRTHNREKQYPIRHLCCRFGIWQSGCSCYGGYGRHHSPELYHRPGISVYVV